MPVAPFIAFLCIFSLFHFLPQDSLFVDVWCDKLVSNALSAVGWRQKHFIMQLKPWSNMSYVKCTDLRHAFPLSRTRIGHKGQSPQVSRTSVKSYIFDTMYRLVSEHPATSSPAIMMRIDFGQNIAGVADAWPINNRYVPKAVSPGQSAILDVEYSGSIKKSLKNAAHPN